MFYYLHFLAPWKMFRRMQPSTSLSTEKYFSKTKHRVELVPAAQPIRTLQDPFKAVLKTSYKNTLVRKYMN